VSLGTSHLQGFSFPGQAQQWIHAINHKFCPLWMGRLPRGEFYFITDPCNGNQFADAEEDARNFSYFKPNKYDASSVWEDVSLFAWRKSPMVDSARCSALSFGSTRMFPLGEPYGSTLLKKWKTTSRRAMSNRKPTMTMTVIAQYHFYFPYIWRLSFPFSCPKW
jgi:hypothetical protein